MKFRHRYLAARAGAFFCLLLTAGAMAVTVAEQQPTASLDANPNGSVANVAGVRSERGNVMGLMPHPEHAVEPAIGGTDGLVLLGSLADALREGDS